MVKIQVKSGYHLNWVEMETQSTTLTDLLFELSNKMTDIWFYDKEKRQYEPNCDVFLNGQAYTDLADQLNTKLKDGDKVEVYVIPLEVRLE